MVNIFVFGHFFGFTSIANYAATIYPRGIELSQTIIKRFKFDDLIVKKNEFEEAYEFNKLLLDQAKAAPIIDNKAKIIKLEKKINSILWWLRRVNKIKTKMGDRLHEGELSERYLDIYSKAVIPMFPLAGTYSAIMLILFGFAEFYKADEIIFINIALILDICMLLLIVFNIKMCSKKLSIWKRNLLLASLITILTLISGSIACLLFHFPKFALSSISNFKLLLIALLSLFLAGIPLFVILFKSARLWWALIYYELVFNLAFWIIQYQFRKIQSA